MLKAQSVNQINKDIKKDYTSLRNRLQSILLDRKFLEEEVEPFFEHLPVIPNERCGLWYCDPNKFVQTSYFKSTDGHTNQWDFSTRRLNLHLIATLKENQGMIIVDSTRRGKKIPDALSKTVPIWCAVLNTLMLESMEIEDDRETLFVPPFTVPKSEHASIKQKLPLLVSKLKQLNIINGKELFESLGGKLLRPMWVYPGCSLLESSIDVFTGEKLDAKWETDDSDNIIPIILCTVSYQAQDGVDKRFGFTYVQGAADDHELWSQGLTPELFWKYIDLFEDPDTPEELLSEHIGRILNDIKREISKLETENVLSSKFHITDELTLGTIVDGLQISGKLATLLSEKYYSVIILSKTCKFTDSSSEQDLEALSLEKQVMQKRNSVMLYSLQSGSKASSKELRQQLASIDSVFQQKFESDSKKPILICCNSGIDMSVGVLLVALCKYYNENWELDTDKKIDKLFIRKHLTKIITHLHGKNVNPSRATLTSVNSFLMSR